MRSLFLGELEEKELETLRCDWPVWARLKQRPPFSDWRTWLVLGGRGAGKTRTGAEWLRGIALGDPHYAGDSAGRLALVGETYDDARDVMIEGESGLLSVHARSDRPVWLPSRREIIWQNGTIGKVFSSADPEGLRGGQFGAAWCDELCKWHAPAITWDMLQFALRVGRYPRQVVTTTPKPIKLLKTLLEDPETIAVRSATRENRFNLASGFLSYVEKTYGKSTLGRQELLGEIVESGAHALWSRDLIETQRISRQPELVYVVVAVDPPASSGSDDKTASCGIVGAGLGTDDKGYVLADHTIKRASPGKWAKKVVSLFHLLKADLVVAEANQGGEMVMSVLENVQPNIPVHMVFANRGKWSRAQPVALLYERQLVHHVGAFPQLEDEMCALKTNGKADGRSPDRVDALVWALHELMLTRQTEPRVRMP